jgi:hypothetical protein
MYQVTIQKLNEYDETITAYKDPDDPEKLYYSKYDMDEAMRNRVVSHQRPTGKKLIDSSQIFEQTVEDLDLQTVIKAINNIK